jgi:hypothetical protein
MQFAFYQGGESLPNYNPRAGNPRSNLGVLGFFLQATFKSKGTEILRIIGKQGYREQGGSCIAGKSGTRRLV